MNIYSISIFHSCWLSSGNGKHAIWTFVAPMLAIILVTILNIKLCLYNCMYIHVYKAMPLFPDQCCVSGACFGKNI